MATEGNGDLPVPDLQTMEELCQPSLNGRGGQIASIAIQATNFGLKNDKIQQVQNSCQFHGLLGDDANKYLNKFLHVTQSIKVNGVIDDTLRLYLFPHSLTHHATAWFDRLPRNSINTFEQMAKMFHGKYFPPSMATKLRNEITTQRSESSSSITSSFDPKIAALKAKMAKINKNLMRVLQVNQQVKAVTPNCETCGGAHSYNDFPATSIKVNGVIDDAFHLYFFPHSLTHHATAWFDYLPRNSINTFEQMTKMFLGKYSPPSMLPLAKLGTYMLREPIKVVILTNLKNFQNQKRNQGNNHHQGNNQGRNQFFQGASHGPNPPSAYQAPAYQASGYQAPVHQPPIPQPQVMTTIEFTNYMKENDSILKNMQTNMTLLTNSNFELKNMFGQFMKMNTASSSGSRTQPSNTITNSKEDLKGITTQSETAYQGPTIPTTPSSLPQVVERETEVTKDMMPPTNNGSTKDVQPSIVQTKTPVPNSKPVVAPVIEPIVAPVSALKPKQKPLISYPSRLHDQKLPDKANDQKKKFFKIFQDLNFNISFIDALIFMPKFGPTIKTLLTNKDKLSELAGTPLNEHCLAVLFKKLPEKLGDPGNASINLIPLSVWNKLSLPELFAMCMTLELANRSISRPVRVAEDVFVKVGTFHFSADFVVVDFDADPRVLLILGRSFLKTERAFIDVFDGELTLRIGKEAITFNLDKTSRYSANYNDMTANRIDVINMACEKYSQEVLGFSNVIASGNPTPYYDPIVSTSSLTLTSFGDSNFLLEEVDAFLALEDDPFRDSAYFGLNSAYKCFIVFSYHMFLKTLAYFTLKQF
uniref:Reverse transcriptase domain-containing protein n=1 Tax=Tanacetum cinerariifolium TaxID=118510 RepID=A0A6L2P4I0_TANCI|nr:reverse transcriptase domain-containing protein [Tanacetum cinerariifolium]